MAKSYAFVDVLMKVMEQLEAIDVVLAIVCVVICYSLLLQRNSKSQGLWSLFGMLSSSFEWCVKYVRLQCKGPWTGKVVIKDPVNLEYVLKKKFPNFVKGDYFRAIFGNIFGGESIFLADGEQWRALKTNMLSLLSSAEFRKEASRVIPMLVHHRLLPLIQNACDRAVPLDLQDVLLRYSFASISLLVLGTDSPQALAVGLPRIPYMEAYEKALEASEERMLMPTFCWKTLRFLNVGTERKLRNALRVVDKFVRDLVSGLKNEIFDDTDVTEGREKIWAILPAYIRQGKVRESVYSDNHLRDFAVTLVMAGRDTTASALTWFFWLVHQYPHTEDTILCEIHDILKQRSANVTSQVQGNDPAPFTSEELKKMQYLHAALTESLRLYPSASIEMTEAAQDDVLPDGTRVQKGSNLLHSFYSMARKESIWGKDCREFRPERWLKNGKFVGESEFKYPIFNGGPRRCAGKEFAYVQMKWVAASVLLRHRVKVVSGHRVAPRFGMILTMKHGLMVTFLPREH
eukprot:Gb_10115 [translate_table: standard]